jgi:chloride channel protein, CIC family
MVAVRAVSWWWWRREPGFKPDPGDESLVALAALSLVAGAGSGLIVAIFRLALARVDDWRGALIARAHQQPLIGPVAVLLGCAASVALAAWLVRRFSPFASGSGIPQVEGALTGDLPPARRD